MRLKSASQALLVLLAASAWASSQNAGPSFDCSKAEGEIEELICSDGELASLDVALSETYAEALKRWPPRCPFGAEGHAARLDPRPEGV